MKKITLLIFLSCIISIISISCSDSSTNPTDAEPTMYNIVATATPSDGGSVSLSESTYEEGEEINLQAEAADGYLFNGWNGDLESADNPLSLTVDQDYTFNANFESIDMAPGITSNFTMRSGTTISNGDLTQWVSSTGDYTLTVPTELGETAPSASDLTLDGTAAITFDGVNESMSMADSTYDRNQDMVQHFVVYIPDDVGEHLFIEDCEDRFNRSGTYYYGSDDRLQLRNGMKRTTHYTDRPIDSWFIITAVRSDDTGLVDMWIDNRKVIDQELIGVSAGTGITIGSKGNQKGHGEHSMVQYVHYLGTTLSDGQIQDNIRYLQNHWGLVGEVQ